MFDNDHGSIKLLLDALDQRAEGLGLSLGDTASGLIEKEHRGVNGEQTAKLHDAAGTGRKVAYGLIGVATKPEVVNNLVGLGGFATLPSWRRR